MRKPPPVRLPVAPWDRPKLELVQPQPLVAAPVQRLAGPVFGGKIGKRDIRYMAQAILQLSDELHEARERIRLLEKAVARGAGGMLE
jgi:hypothetical protein